MTDLNQVREELWQNVCKVSMHSLSIGDNKMSRKSATTPNAVSTSLKTGDIIWVPYRKSPKWPAVVKNVYPKKLTYFFLPEPQKGKPPTFKTTPKSASLFNENDSLPANANKDLLEAYRAALGIVRGEIQLRCISHNAKRNNAEADPHSPSTSNSSLVDVPVKKPRLSSVNDGQQKTFIPYTVILLDTTEIPGWPVLFLDKSDESEILGRRFPLSENLEGQRYPLKWCHNVTYAGVEELIATNDCKGCPNYVRALVSAQEFMENPQNYITLPEGFTYPQKPRPLLAKPTPSERPPSAVKKEVAMELEFEEEDEEEEQKVEEEKDEKPISKFSQNGLALANLSLSSSKNDVFKAMLSYEAREHVEKMFAGQVSSKRNTEYHRAEDATDATFSFFCGDYLNFAELEIVIAEIHNWIALSPKLPKMSLLAEMHYISKVVLPELCIFALARINQISQKDAEKLFEKSTKSKNTVQQQPAPPSSQERRGRTAARQASNVPGNSFEQLLRAVSIERSK